METKIKQVQEVLDVATRIKSALEDALKVYDGLSLEQIIETMNNIVDIHKESEGILDGNPISHTYLYNSMLHVDWILVDAHEEYEPFDKPIGKSNLIKAISKIDKYIEDAASDNTALKILSREYESERRDSLARILKGDSIKDVASFEKVIDDINSLRTNDVVLTVFGKTYVHPDECLIRQVQMLIASGRLSTEDVKMTDMGYVCKFNENGTIYSHLASSVLNDNCDYVFEVIGLGQ